PNGTIWYAHQLDMTLARSMTRLAVDAQRRYARVPTLRRCIEPNVDLAPMALLAVCESGRVAEDALWWPVTTVGERELARDRDPTFLGARFRVAEPGGGLTAPIEGKDSPG